MEYRIRLVSADGLEGPIERTRDLHLPRLTVLHRELNVAVAEGSELLAPALMYREYRHRGRMEAPDIYIFDEVIR